VSGASPPGTDAALPRITLVTPSFNAARTIERTLRSIEEQRYPSLQVICMDGGSTDGTQAVIARFPHLVGELASEKDRGAAHALNKGFRRADGEIFCWLNADDALAPGALHRVARAFREDPRADVITGGCLRVYADGSRVETAVPDWFVESIALRNGFEQPSTFWRAGIHRRAGELDESYRFAFDWEWWNRLRVHGARFVRIDGVLSHYHFSEDNLTSRGAEKVIDEMHRITATYASPGIAAAYRFLYRTFDLRGYYDAPWQLTGLRRFVFRRTLSAMRVVFGRNVIDSYNWNWASKQVRGLVWYR
jgi:glycosyltransferase involved in cell wall biosynthesis